MVLVIYFSNFYLQSIFFSILITGGNIFFISGPEKTEGGS